MSTIALVAGHTQGTGAEALDGTDEWSWNMEVLQHLRKMLVDAGHVVVTLQRKAGLGYTSAMKQLGREMRGVAADVCLELHFNCSNGAGCGFEFLHLDKSERGQALALSLANRFRQRFSELKGRGFHGSKPTKSHARGGAFLLHTPCPAVICEPGFADNVGDWAELKDAPEMVAAAYAAGLGDYLKN